MEVHVQLAEGNFRDVRLLRSQEFHGPLVKAYQAIKGLEAPESGELVAITPRIDGRAGSKDVDGADDARDLAVASAVDDRHVRKEEHAVERVRKADRRSACAAQKARERGHHGQTLLARRVGAKFVHAEARLVAKGKLRARPLAQVDPVAGDVPLEDAVRRVQLNDMRARFFAFVQMLCTCPTSRSRLCVTSSGVWLVSPPAVFLCALRFCPRPPTA